MRFSASVDAFYLVPPPATAYTDYSNRLLSIAQYHAATLFIPVSGAGSSVEDARAADYMFDATGGTCRTFIQDSETMLDLHDKDRFMGLVGRLGMTAPSGRMVKTVNQAVEYLRSQGSREPKFVLKCMGLDENRGDMTLFPLEADDDKLSRTRAALEGLATRITDECPYVFQEFIAGQGEPIVTSTGSADAHRPSRILYPRLRRRRPGDFVCDMSLQRHAHDV